MGMFRSVVSLIVIAFGLSGCVSVRSHVSFSSILEAKDLGKRVVVTGYPAEAERSLLFITKLRAPVELAFRKKGYIIVKSKSDADLIAFVSYGIDGGKVVSQTSSIPVYGQTGGGTAHHSGTAYGSGTSVSYSGSSYTMPTYGVVGSSTISSSRNIFSRQVAIDLVDIQSLNSKHPRKLMEGRVVSKGSCGAIEGVYKEMIEALFSKYPSGSGGVTVQGDGSC
jgi:hypothetical protein